MENKIVNDPSINIQFDKSSLYEPPYSDLGAIEKIGNNEVIKSDLEDIQNHSLFINKEEYLEIFNFNKEKNNEKKSARLSTDEKSNNLTKNIACKSHCYSINLKETIPEINNIINKKESLRNKYLTKSISYNSNSNSSRLDIVDNNYSLTTRAFSCFVSRNSKFNIDSFVKLCEKMKSEVALSKSMRRNIVTKNDESNKPKSEYMIKKIYKSKPIKKFDSRDKIHICKCNIL